MLNHFFAGIFDGQYTAVITVGDFLLCMLVSLIAGLILAAGYTVRNRYSGSFLMTLVLLPVIVCVVIMMVNGNVGTGVAVAGAFSLVRFRSAPGTAREISAIFLAMSAGLLTGMGYLGYALLFIVIMTAIMAGLNGVDFGSRKREARYKTLQITIPEDLDYTGVFDELFNTYTQFHELVRVKTTNMGSLFRLTYRIVLKDEQSEKEMIDKIRCRNGNLEISVSYQETASAEL